MICYLTHHNQFNREGYFELFLEAWLDVFLEYCEHQNTNDRYNERGYIRLIQPGNNFYVSLKCKEISIIITWLLFG